jgi:outer membrane protein assembly factor BamA
VTAFLLLLALSASPQAQEVLSEIRIQGNLLTPDDEVRVLAGLEIGMRVTTDTPAEVAARLRAAGRFERVEVLKRFASIADPTQIVLVVIVDEGPVKIEYGAGPDTPARVVRRRGLRLLYLPVLNFEDGYGFAYGVRIARPNPIGSRSRLSFPLTWGGDKRAGAELEKVFASGPVTRVEVGASVSRRQHPFYEEEDDRQRGWVTAERDLTRSLRASTTAGWQRAALLDRPEGSAAFLQTGADVVFDTRLDPVLPRNAVYARAAWNRSNVPEGAVNQTTVDTRGYVGLFGQSVLVVRAVREDADAPLPPYLKSMLGGMPNLRGFKRGTAVGDTLVAGTVELRVPLTSPLSFGKLGVAAFFDAGATYDEGVRLDDAKLQRAVGGGVWFSVAWVRLNLSVAHGLGGTTRVHFGTSVSP